MPKQIGKLRIVKETVRTLAEGATSAASIYSARCYTSQIGCISDSRCPACWTE